MRSSPEPVNSLYPTMMLPAALQSGSGVGDPSWSQSVCPRPLRTWRFVESKTTDSTESIVSSDMYWVNVSSAVISAAFEFEKLVLFAMAVALIEISAVLPPIPEVLDEIVLPLAVMAPAFAVIALWFAEIVVAAAVAAAWIAVISVVWPPTVV